MQKPELKLTKWGLRKLLMAAGVYPKWWWSYGRCEAELRAAKAEEQLALHRRIKPSPSMTIGIAGEDLEVGDTVCVDLNGDGKGEIFKVGGVAEGSIDVEVTEQQARNLRSGRRLDVSMGEPVRIDGVVPEVGETVELDPVELGLMTEEEWMDEQRNPRPKGVYEITDVGGKDKAWRLERKLTGGARLPFPGETSAQANWRADHGVELPVGPIGIANEWCMNAHKSPDPFAANDLAKLMESLKERHWPGGDMAGVDHWLWKAESGESYGSSVLEQWDLKRASLLSAQCVGWITWDGDAPTWVELETWRGMVEHETE